MPEVEGIPGSASRSLREAQCGPPLFGLRWPPAPAEGLAGSFPTSAPAGPMQGLGMWALQSNRLGSFVVTLILTNLRLLRLNTARKNNTII